MRITFKVKNAQIKSKVKFRLQDLFPFINKWYSDLFQLFSIFLARKIKLKFSLRTFFRCCIALKSDFTDFVSLCHVQLLDQLTCPGGRAT